jgi:GT2 family glycosyltransferase
MRVSIMITTRNRLDELRRTVQMLGKLDPSPDEILITADGCVGGTAEFVTSALPNVKLIVNEPAIGSVASRDRMMRQAKGDLVLALDDDSYPEQSDCIAHIIPFFQQRAELAVLHFPQRTDEYPETLAETKFGSEEHLTRSFANAGAVLRRSNYLQLPGFEPRFYHMYEEPDYALQCVAAGYDVLFSPIVTIRHHYSGRARDEIGIHHRHARNEFWSTLMRCPFPFGLAMLSWRFFSQFRYAWKRGWSWIVREPQWWVQAVAGVPHFLRKRKPVSRAAYKRWLALP